THESADSPTPRATDSGAVCPPAGRRLWLRTSGASGRGGATGRLLVDEQRLDKFQRSDRRPAAIKPRSRCRRRTASSLALASTSTVSLRAGQSLGTSEGST